MMSGFLLIPTAKALQNSARATGSSIALKELFLPDSDYMQILYHPYGIGLTTFALTVLITGFTYRKWKENSSIALKELFLPDSDYMQILYHPYGIGLTTFALTVLITGFTYRKWKEKYIHIACFFVIMIPVFQYVLNGGLYIRGKVLIPMLPLLCYLIALYLEKQRKGEISFGRGILVFQYVLNGGLYIRGKVLIPMLPLLCYLIALYLEKQRKGEISFGRGILPFIVTIIILWEGREPGKITEISCLLLADAGIMLLCGLLFYRRHHEKIFLFVSIGMVFIYGTIMNGWFSQRTERDFFNQVTDTNYSQITKEILEKEKGFYRMEQAGTRKIDAANLNRIWSGEQYSSSVYSSTYNEEYQKFRKEIFQIEQQSGYRYKLQSDNQRNPGKRKRVLPHGTGRNTEDRCCKSEQNLVWRTV